MEDKLEKYVSRQTRHFLCLVFLYKRLPYFEPKQSYSRIYYGRAGWEMSHSVESVNPKQMKQDVQDISADRREPSNEGNHNCSLLTKAEHRVRIV